MAYQQAHTGIRKLFVGRRWSTGYIGATSCTVKRATRADLRLTPLSLPLSFPLSPALWLFVSRSPSLVCPSTPLARSNARLLRSVPFCSLLFSPLSPLFRRLARSLARSALSSLSADAATPARLTQPNPRANFIPRRLTTTDGRRRPRRRRRRHRTRVTRHAVSTVTVCSCVLRSVFSRVVHLRLPRTAIRIPVHEWQSSGCGDSHREREKEGTLGNRKEKKS